MFQRTATVFLCASAVILAAACGGGSSGGGNKDLIGSARAYLEKEDYKAAIIQLKSALQKNAQSGEARFLLGKAMFESGDLASAVVELRKARELKYDEQMVAPLLARALMQQGDSHGVLAQFATTQLADPRALADLKVSVATAYLAQDQKDKGEAELQTALAAAPDHVGAKLLQARLTADKGDHDRAKALVEQVLAASPKSADAWMLKGELLQIVDKDRKGAIAAFRQAVAVKPTMLAAHVAVVSALFADGDTAGAAAQVEQMKKHFANHPRTKLFEAELAYHAKDWKAARDHIRPVVQALPNNPIALQVAGAAEYRLGGLQQAETYLAKALQTAPELVIARRMLAQIYLRTGQPAKVLDTLKPMLDREPDAIVLQMAAEAHLQSGDAAKAEQLFDRAAKLKPDDPRIRTARALTQLGKGKAETAIAELEAISGSDAGALADLALVSAHMRRKEFDKALKAIDVIARKQPDKPLAANLRGRVLALKNDIAGARDSFLRAQQIDPMYFPAAAGLAALDLASKKPDDARKHFDELLRRDPNNVPAKQALALLLMRTGHSGDEVAKLLTDAVKSNPSDVRAQLMLINFQLERRDTKAALAAARDANTALTDHPEILMALGRANLAAQDQQQAITIFNRLSVVAPKSPQPHLGLADAYLALKDRPAASRSLKRALELEPRLVQAQRGLVAIALADKQPAQALETARSVQKQYPQEALGQVLEGDVEIARKNLPAALAAYQAAVKKAHPEEAATRVHQTLSAMGQTQEADRFAASWLQANPADAVFPFYLADRALAAKDLPLAETRYRKVLELQPNNPLALNNVAWLMVQQAKPGGVPFAEKANQLLPGRPALMDTLALALALEKQVPRAVDIQKQAVERAPNDGSLRMNLAKLYIQADQKPLARIELERLRKMGREYPNQEAVSQLLKTL